MPCVPLTPSYNICCWPHLALIVWYVLQVTKPFWGRNALLHWMRFTVHWNSLPLTFVRQVLISTYYTNVITVTTSISNAIMWALQKVGFTASATQVSQPWLSCACTKVVLTRARICLIYALVAELLTDHFAVQWVPTPTTNCSPLSIDVHFHTSFSLTGPTSQPNSSNWTGESAQSAFGGQHGVTVHRKRSWDVVKMATITVALVLKHTHKHTQ